MSDNPDINSGEAAPGAEFPDIPPIETDLGKYDLDEGEEEGGDSALPEEAEEIPLTPEEKKLRDRREVIRALGLLSQIGITMLVCVAIGVFFGQMMDRLLGSSPWLLIFGAFLGGGAAIKVMIDIIIKK